LNNEPGNFDSAAKMVTRAYCFVATVTLSLMVSATATAQEAATPSEEPLGRRFVLGAALGLERFDTNVTLTDRDTGNSIFVDGEGSFGLPETQTIPLLYGAARINEKHAVGFYTFRVSREGTALAVNADYGNLNVNGAVTFRDRTSFSYLNYRYTFFDDQQTTIQALLGLYAIDLKFDLSARGEVRLDGEVINSGVYSETIDQFAPLPLIGLDYWSRVTDRWFLGGKVSFVYGAYDDVSALVVDAQLRARYQMTERLSMITGLSFLSADVEIKRKDRINDVSYGYEGLFLGLDFSF
jgi:hypothetical protein